MTYIHNIILLIVAGGFLYLTRTIEARKQNTDNFADTIIVQQNIGAAIRRLGLYLACAIGLQGAISGASMGFLQDISSLVVYGLITVALLNTVQILNIHGFIGLNKESIKQGKTNKSAALVEASLYIATGLVIKGSLTGDTSGEFINVLVTGVISTVIFFVIGQILLLICTELYLKFTPFDDVKEIKEDNLSAAICISSTIVAVGIILCHAISGPSPSLITGLISVLTHSILGITLLFAIEIIADKLFLPNEKLSTLVSRNKNTAAALIIAGVKIGLSLLIVGAVV